jgi:hypothetical protein
MDEVVGAEERSRASIVCGDRKPQHVRAADHSDYRAVRSTTGIPPIPSSRSTSTSSRTEASGEIVTTSLFIGSAMDADMTTPPGQSALLKNDRCGMRGEWGNTDAGASMVPT